jgi:O-antigen ligase
MSPAEPSPRHTQWQDRAETAARWTALALGLSIPISTALDNLLLPLLVLLWLASGGFAGKWALVRRNPVALLAILLFVWLLAGMSYAAVPVGERLGVLGKYRELLLIPLLATLFRTPQERGLALAFFAAAMGVTLLASYGIALEVLPPLILAEGIPGNPVVFKRQITHNFFMALAAFFFAVWALEARTPSKRMAFWASALLATANVLFMVQGRTGYVVLSALITLLFFERLRLKGVIAAATLLGVLFAAAYGLSHSFKSRVDMAVQEALAWKAEEAQSSSIGWRLEYLVNSLAVFVRNPLLGVGTGGFHQAYAEQVAGTQKERTHNPHNEYLMIAVQVGLPGLALLLLLFATQLRLAAQLSCATERVLARGVVLAVAVGCLFNSLLLDHAEGLFYAWASGILFSGLGQRPPGSAANAVQ